MTTGAPFIGSKISLISKAEIRYEGILYQVDTKESTVTLAKGRLKKCTDCEVQLCVPCFQTVRSFGTENRPSAKHIPPRSEVYEFIIFRGSDIKDLNVSEMPDEPNSPPQDPAILSAVSVGICVDVLYLELPILLQQSTAPLPAATVAPTTAASHPVVPAQRPPPPAPHSAHPHYYSQPPAPGMGGYTPFGMPYYRQQPPLMMGAGGPPPGVPHPHPHAPAEAATSQG